MSTFAPEIYNSVNNIDMLFNFLAEIVDEEDFLYEIKLLLIGEGRVGKTSIAKSLSNEEYILEDEHTTEGIDIQPWLIQPEEFEELGIEIDKEFRVNIWDFGGQEIYHATHQFFLTKRSVYILVTESRKEDKHEDFYYWLNIVKLLGDKSPVIITLNKCDQPTKDLPINEYQKAFKNIIEFRKISCIPNYRDTIESLKCEIKRIITNPVHVPHISTALPAVWVRIREELQYIQQEMEYISYQEYLDICLSYSLNEKRALHLSSFFHDLGVFLHFQDDIELFDTVFLDHEWVTDGVYKVLDNTLVKTKLWQIYR
ncbi:MAG: GTP-binding protein [Calditrichae bacterium]|nr:GTP-binding protein [Calditrichia bacterium]